MPEQLKSLQERVADWMLECFTPEIAADTLERNDRFIEESLELVRSLNYSADRAHALVDYVFGRDVGEPTQEVGGVMVTLAALCGPNKLDMIAAGEVEYNRINQPAIIEKIRAKQALKPTGSALPIPTDETRPAPAHFILCNSVGNLVYGKCDCNYPLGTTLEPFIKGCQDQQSTDAGKWRAALKTSGCAEDQLNAPEPEITDEQWDQLKADGPKPPGPLTPATEDGFAPAAAISQPSAMTEEWCMKMAKLEGGCEIGAGLPDHPLRTGTTHCEAGCKYGVESKHSDHCNSALGNVIDAPATDSGLVADELEQLLSRKRERETSDDQIGWEAACDQIAMLVSNNADTILTALRSDGWLKAGFWKEKAEQLEHAKVVFDEKYLTKYQKAIRSPDKELMRAIRIELEIAMNSADPHTYVRSALSSIKEALTHLEAGGE